MDPTPEQQPTPAYPAFGEFIKTQRMLAQMSLRQASAIARISNPYLSQIEHGWVLPSVAVMSKLADAFSLSAETLLTEAAKAAGGSTPASRQSPEEAIQRDTRLSVEEKKALLLVLASFTESASTQPTAANLSTSQQTPPRQTHTRQPRPQGSTSMTDLRFDGRVAVITGAGGGLGRSHALALASRGAHVVVNDIGGSVNGQGASSTPGEAVVAEIVALGGSAIANRDSVATPAGGQAIIDAAMDAFGRVDILVNNAGILRDQAFHKMDAETIDAVLDVHLKGALYVTRPAFAIMREQGYGRIISTTSASGLFGNFGQANYGAAKAGLAGLTRVLALEGASKGIKANAIAPLAATRMTEGLLGDLLELITPDSVSAVVAYLAHEDCEVSGNFYSVAGGRVARIFVGETPGVVLPGTTPEAVRDSLTQIDDTTGYILPESLTDAASIISEALNRASVDAH